MERILELLRAVEELETKMLNRPYFPRLVVLPNGEVTLYWQDRQDVRRLYQSDAKLGNISNLEDVGKKLEDTATDWYTNKVE